MPMTLVFKRSKCFVHQGESGTKKFLAGAAPANPVPVPFWVADTQTYAQGIKDKSIVNLTPPHLMPGYRAPVEAAPAPKPVEKTAAELADEADEAERRAAEEAAKAAAKADDGGDGDGDGDGEQTEPPQQPFGGQPMTPAQPGPNVGSVRAGGKRGK